MLLISKPTDLNYQVVQAYYQETVVAHSTYIYNNLK